MNMNKRKKISHRGTENTEKKMAKRRGYIHRLRRLEQIIYEEF